jgi:hypothetical protein
MSKTQYFSDISPYNRQFTDQIFIFFAEIVFTKKNYFISN